MKFYQLAVDPQGLGWTQKHLIDNHVESYHGCDIRMKWRCAAVKGVLENELPFVRENPPKVFKRH
jgi:hypothetical protein